MTKQVILVAALAFTGCARALHSASGIAGSAVQNLGCKTSQSELWDSLQRVAENGEDYPSSAEIRQALNTALKPTNSSQKTYIDTFVANYETTIDGIRQKFDPSNTQAWRRALSEMEVGIRITENHVQLSDAISASLRKLAAAETALDATCTKPEPTLPVSNGTSPVPPPVQTTYDNVWDQLKATQPLEVYGARRVLATAYQTCDTLSLPPMTSATPSVSGVSEDAIPNAENGGIVRHYGNLATIDATHYYIHGLTLPKSTCQEVRNHPPIYDFGGKPFSTASLQTTLNLLRGDGGSGSEVFGVDCSGFIFTALASAGLRMIDPNPDTPLKATMVLGTPAAAFKEPQNNHMSCLAKITVTKENSIAAGDIVATTGHIIMIESVGPDPLGLNQITSALKCGSVSYKNFDFIIAQSSPSKGSIGINRILAKDYLGGSTTMRIGLERYAAAACRAKFGLPTALVSPDLSVVRHKRTAECMSPEFQLTGSDCVSSCKAL